MHDSNSQPSDTGDTGTPRDISHGVADGNVLELLRFLLKLDEEISPPTDTFDMIREKQINDWEAGTGQKWPDYANDPLLDM